MLEQGCGYACSWGPDAGRLENAFDHEIVTAQLAGRAYVADDDVVMTLSYVEESFDEALWFAVFNTFPAYGGDALVAICEADLARQAESRLTNCRQLSDDVLGQEDEPDD